MERREQTGPGSDWKLVGLPSEDANAWLEMRGQGWLVAWLACSGWSEGLSLHCQPLSCLSFMLTRLVLGPCLIRIPSNLQVIPAPC